MTLKEILLRLSAIKNEIKTRGASMSAEEIRVLNKEVDELKAEKRKLEKRSAKVETRHSLLDNIAKGNINTQKINFLNTDKNTEQRENAEAKEYRNAFLKTLMGVDLNEVEKRALTKLATDKTVLPLSTSVELLDHIKAKTTILEKINLTHIKGQVAIYLSDPAEVVGVHAEGTDVTPEAFKPIKVELNGYELVKPIEISKTVANMTVDGFEAWLIEALSDVIARSIEYFMINGTGTNQPTGIEKCTVWGAENSITIAASAKPTNENVLALIAMLPSYYDANANFVMSKKTLFTDIMPLKDDAKNNIVRFENGKYYIYGYEVELNDHVKFHDMYLGDLKTVAGNLSEEMDVQKEFVPLRQTFRFFGVATFDCKPARKDAFVKMTKA